MGAFEGSISFKTFFVDGEPSEGFQDEFLARMTQTAFVELSPDTEDERAIGWVCIDSPLDTNFTRKSTIFNQYLALSLRVDKWSMPSTLLKAHIKEATRELLVKKNVPALSRRDKEELKAVITSKLKRRIVPSMKVVDMVWNIHTKVVRFWTHSTALCEEFQELFEDTFGMTLTPDSPYVAAKMEGLDEDDLQKMAEVEPEWFIRPPTE